MLETSIYIAVALSLAWWNGANDSFKGVATLWASGTAGYRGALAWGLLTTFMGSAAALFLAGDLVLRFSGRGLVPDAVAATPRFLLASGVAAMATVLLATRLGMPVSTTHALLGGLVGAGVASSGVAGIHAIRLAGTFVAPLLLSPLVAATGCALLYPPLRRLRIARGLDESACLCAQTTSSVAASSAEGAPASVLVARATLAPTLALANAADCPTPAGRIGFEIRSSMRVLHVIAAGAVGFARGLNDTPKIAGLLVLVPALGGGTGMLWIAAAMLLGGALGARRVADTLSWRITEMNTGQALVGAVVTASLVGGASLLSLPVSTTHVSCGALFGIGAVTSRARWSTIRAIVLAWLVTLPTALLVSWVAYSVLP